MGLTTHDSSISPINPADYFSEASEIGTAQNVTFPSFTELAAEEKRAKAEAASAAPSQERKENAGEMITRLVEENRPTRRTVTPTHYKQATKFQVGSEIDEAGLSAIEFRIYAPLVRRADKDGKCFPSIAVICRYCKCERVTAVKAIEVLEARRFISRQKQWHKPTIYKIGEAKELVPSHGE
jgi:hypothetical protein